MDRFSDIALRGIRRMLLPFHNNKPKPPQINMDRQATTAAIRELLEGDNPCMIARSANTELNAVVNYLGVKYSPHSLWKFITWQTFQWWWSPVWMRNMQRNAGFFPPTEEAISKFAELMLEDYKQVDIWCSWQYKEKYILQYLPQDVTMVPFLYHVPTFLSSDASMQWPQALRGKNVLVVYPFAETIEKQYQKRKYLFNDPEFLPEFNLITLKAVQSLGGESEFDTWFDALEYMKEEMDKIDYDIAIIGCGAYGFCLAAHAKRTGHKAFHLGGITQMLFGIKAKRWEEQGDDILYNEYWCRPSIEEKPASADKVEGGCYW